MNSEIHPRILRRDEILEIVQALIKGQLFEHVPENTGNEKAWAALKFVADSYSAVWAEPSGYSWAALVSANRPPVRLFKDADSQTWEVF